MRTMLLVAAAIALLGIVAGCATKDAAKTEPAKVETAKAEPAEPKPLIQYVDTPTGRWMIHDENRPAPPIITPGAECGAAPSDAVVLFDGTQASMPPTGPTRRASPPSGSSGTGPWSRSRRPGTSRPSSSSAPASSTSSSRRRPR